MIYYIELYFLFFCLFVFFIVVMFYFVLFLNICQADQLRLQYILKDVQSGKTSSELGHLPHEDYLWTSFPRKENDVWEKRYKLFYGIPENVDLILVK